MGKQEKNIVKMRINAFFNKLIAPKCTPLTLLQNLQNARIYHFFPFHRPKVATATTWVMHHSSSHHSAAPAKRQLA